MTKQTSSKKLVFSSTTNYDTNSQAEKIVKNLKVKLDNLSILYYQKKQNTKHLSIQKLWTQNNLTTCV